MREKDRKEIRLKTTFVVILSVAIVGMLVYTIFAVTRVMRENAAITQSAAGVGAAAVRVESTLFNDKVFIPLQMVPEIFAGETAETLVARLQQDEGVKSAKISGGAVVLTVTRDYRQSMVNDMRSRIDSFLSELVNGSNAPSVRKVTYSSDMSTFSVEVDAAIFSTNGDKEAVGKLAPMALYYQALLGGGPQGVSISFLNAADGSNLDAVSYH